MLQYKTIEPATLELLKRLMLVNPFNSLRLAGGTSLALQLGHRNSIDIDLFGDLQVDETELDSFLRDLGTIELIKKTANIYIYLIDNIKVDIVNYHYQWLDDVLSIDNLRLATIKDIAAMKFAAITGRGSKKDFIDLYFILKHYSIADILNFYKTKYPNGSEIIVLKSLTYFADADLESNPRMFIKVSWKKVKEQIISSVQQYFNNLTI